uniref:Apolipoprotein F n=2 Tax=Gadus morhua TaxID=8049 RepID=A0A8C5FUG0_GADMO
MMCSQMRWLLVIQLLLTEQALCRSTSPLAHRSAPLPSSNLQDGDGSTRPARQSVLGSRPHGGFKHFPVHEGQRIHSAKRMISLLREKLVGRIHNHIQSQENVSCEELLSASTMEDPRSPLFPQELLGLSLVPVLAVADCHQEAVALMLQLYDLLGVADTEELLVEVEALIERRISRAVASTAAAAAATSPPPPAETQRVDEMQMEAVMFNIQQLARESKTLQGTSGREKHWEVCEGWAQVNGTLLLGKAVEGPSEGLEEALRACESLGLQCAGIAHGGGGGGLLKAGRSKYSAVLKKGSRVVPAADSSDCWLRLCRAEKEPWSPAAGRRWRRGADADDHCSDRKEQNIYSVVEWIPAVSTLYSLGTAMYYASLNCTETARERALLSAVDLGTDALMAVTGGTAGVAGYALGVGVKTGVKASLKYLLGSMKDEDLLVNQYTWEEEVLRMQED